MQEIGVPALVAEGAVLRAAHPGRDRERGAERVRIGDVVVDAVAAEHRAFRCVETPGILDHARAGDRRRSRAARQGCAAPNELRLHLGSDGRYFRYGSTTQNLTLAPNSCKINSAEPLIDEIDEEGGAGKTIRISGEVKSSPRPKARPTAPDVPQEVAIAMAEGMPQCSPVLLEPIG